MGMDALQRLDVWRRACRLSADVFVLLASSREYAFRDQLSRSALSVASNIAEGYGRGSAGDRIQFLRIARGSCNEAWTQLQIGVAADIIDPQAAARLIDEAAEIARMIGGLIKYLESQSS